MKNLICTLQTAGIPAGALTSPRPASRNFTSVNRSSNQTSFASAAMAVLMLIIGCSTGWANVATFTTAGNYTWTCPSGVTSVEVECWGSGGGGGGAGASYNAAGGGAGGSYVQVATMSVTPGTVYNLTVGAGGAGGTTISNTANPSVDNGGTGGSSYFGNSVAGNPSDAQALAIGGMGGDGNVIPGLTTSTRTGGAAGGTASNTGNLPADATVNNAGTGGGTSSPPVGLGSTHASSGAGGAGAGASGSSGGGAGGAARTSGGVAGNPGTAPGGGGSGGYQAGAANTAPGGAGGAGEVQITYTGPESIYTVLPGETFTSGSGLSGSPNAQNAGTAFMATLYYVEPDGVTVDTSQNSTVNITVTGPATGTFFPSTPTAVAFSAGVGTINVTLNDATSTTLSSTDGTFPGNASSAVAVTAGPAEQLQVLMPGETAAPGTVTGKSGVPDTLTAGTTVSVTINAVDAYWNLASSTLRILFTSSDTNATLPGSDPLVGGEKIIAVTFRTAGSWTLTATDTNATPLTADTGSSVTVNPGPAAQLQVLMPGETAAPGTGAGKNGTPNAQAVGAPVSVTVNAVDANWNFVSTNTDSVAITSSDTSAILPPNAALTAGTKMFNVTFETAGSQTVTATDQSSSPLSPNTGSLTTVNAPPSIPEIIGFSLSGTNLAISGTNGTIGGSYGILASTNLALPLAQWTPILSNAVFDGSGNFNTNFPLNSTLDSNAPRQYFIIQSPSP